MVRKVKVPVIGGLSKVVRVDPGAAGTTIAEYGSGTITLAQLKAALGVTSASSSKSGSTGAGAGTAAIAPGPGLSGGGTLVGVVPIQLVAPIPMLSSDDGGGGGDGEPGPPGQRGLDGAAGAQGPQGPAVFFLPDDPPEALDAVPGSPGPAGGTGAQGPAGPAVFFLPDDPESALDAVPGAAGAPGPTGAAGVQGPPGISVFMPEDGENGEPGPPGPVGPAGSGGSTSAANITPDTHPATPTPFDDEFEEAALDTTGSRFAGANPWAWVNQSGASALVSNGSLQLSAVPNNGAFNLISQTPPAAPWTIEARCAIPLLENNAAYAGLLLYNSATGGNVFFGAAYNAYTSLQPGIGVAVSNQWPSGGGATISAIAQYYGSSLWLLLAQFWYYQIVFDGTTLTYNVSRSGIPGTFSKIYSGAAANDLGGAPTHFGLAVASYGASAPALLVCDWFRRTA